MDVALNFLLGIIHFNYLNFFGEIFSLLTPNTIVSLAVGYFFIVWISIIIWVTKDITNRTNSLFLQIFSILIVLLGTPLSVVIYLLIRPSRTLFEKYYDSEYFVEDYEEEKTTKCKNCNFEVKSDYKYCPNCKKCLKNECIECKAILPEGLKVCPYCGNDQIKKEVEVKKEITKEVKIEEKQEIKTENITPEIIKTPEVNIEVNEILESKD